MSQPGKETDLDVQREFNRVASDLKFARKSRAWSLTGSILQSATGILNMALGNVAIGAMWTSFAAANAGDTIARCKSKNALQKRYDALSKELDLRRLAPDGTLREEGNDAPKESNFVKRKRKPGPRFDQ